MADRTETLPREATVDDLYGIEGKAELVDGRIIHFPLTGDAHGRACLAVAMALRQYEREQGGDLAHAEPAVPGWRLPVDELFD